MKLTLTTAEGVLHIEFEPAPGAANPEHREVDMGSLVERADPHPEVDRPIGFRRREQEDE